MTRNFAFLAALLVASATTLPVVQAKAQQATDDGIAAITLPEPQLRNFLTRAIFTTTTIKMVNIPQPGRGHLVVTRTKLGTLVWVPGRVFFSF